MALPAGVEEVTSVVDKTQSYCLNEKSTRPLENVFNGAEGVSLESDADHQLLLHLVFREPVRVHSLKMTANDDETCPTTVKLYANCVDVGFSDMEDQEPTQTLELGPADMAPHATIPLRYVKWQRVDALTIFIEENAGAETTVINTLKIFGAPLAGQGGVDVSNIHNVGKENG